MSGKVFSILSAHHQ